MGKFRKTIVMTTVLIIGCVATYGIVEYSSQKGLKSSTVQNDKSLAMYIEDESGNYQLSSSKEFPKEGYVLNLEKSSCKNGGVLSQDENTKGINLRTSKQDGCNLYFSIEKCETTTLVNGLKVFDSNVTDYSKCGGENMYTFDHDEAAQTTGWSESERRDYRYIGQSPNNWVKFNGEDWRIIGVFTAETSTGAKEQLIKIIRNESIGTLVWDSGNKNEWPSSSLKKLLNEGNYYNRINTYVNTGLDSTAKSKIEEVKWYLGGSSTEMGLGGPDYYNFERGEKTCVTTGKCSGQTRSTNTIAQIGLMYPSDYVYTYANGVDSICYKNGYTCYTSIGAIPENGWLFNSTFQYTISPLTDLKIFQVSSDGHVGFRSVNIITGVRPSVYLKSSVKITGGDGTQSNPYTVE